METIAENRTQEVKIVTAEFQELWKLVEKRILTEARPTVNAPAPPGPSPSPKQGTAGP